MNKKLFEVSSDEELNRIFTKAHYLEEAENSLNESSLQFLIVEKIDKAEANKVKRALKASRDQIAKLETYLNGLKAKGLDLGEMPTITNMIKDMGDAIDKAQGDFAAVNFDSGKIASFMGSKLTAPGIAKAAIAIQTKANQFLSGFTDALQNIEDNLVPLAKDENVKNAPLRDIAGQGGIPDEAKLEKGIKTAIEKALKPKGFLAKLKGFFAKNMPGAQGKILKSIPSLDPAAAADELTAAIMGTSLSVFDAADLKDTKVPMEDFDDIAKEAAEAEEAAEEKADAGGAGGAPAEVDPKTASKDELIQYLMDTIKSNSGGNLPAAFRQSSEKEIEQAVEDDIAALRRGEPIEDVAEEAAADGVEGAEGAEGPKEKWSNISDDFFQNTTDIVAAKKFLDDLKGNEKFNAAVASRISMEESLSELKMKDFLFEDVPFDVLEKSAEQATDKAPVRSSLTGQMAGVLDSAGLDVTGAPADAAKGAEEAEADKPDAEDAPPEDNKGEEAPKGPAPKEGEIYNYTTNKGKETTVKIVQVFDDGDVMVNSSDDKGGFKKNKFRFSSSKLGEKIEGGADAGGGGAAEPPPATEKEGEKEQKEIEQELQAAVQKEQGDDQTPGSAAMGALDTWLGGLSATSKKSLASKKRIDQLKNLVQTGLDKTSKAVERQVSNAIKKWRGEHEETLIKSRRFAKKNFDSLQSLIPQLAASMLKKSNESKFSLNPANVDKIVYEFLNRKFYKGSDNILAEETISEQEKDLIVYRMNKLAGLE